MDTTSKQESIYLIVEMVKQCKRTVLTEEVS